MNGLSEFELDDRNPVPIARIRGEIDLSNADEVLRSLEGAVGADSPGLVVDLRELEYLDSAGVRLLFQAAGTVTSAGGMFVALVASDSPIRRVLELADASAVFPLEETEEAAVGLVAS